MNKQAITINANQKITMVPAAKKAKGKLFFSAQEQQAAEQEHNRALEMEQTKAQQAMDLQKQSAANMPKPTKA